MELRTVPEMNISQLAQKIDDDTLQERMKRSKDIDINQYFDELLESQDILDIFVRLKDR
jgi:hypothetical protein